MQEVIRFYENYGKLHQAASAKSPTPGRDFYDESLYRVLGSLRRISRELRVCDLGCGTGEKLSSLARFEGFRLTGVDLHQDSVVVGGEAIREDITAYLKSSNDGHDLYILNDVIEHLDAANVMEILELIAAKARGGAYIYIRTPNGSSPFCGHYQYGDLTHKSLFNQISIGHMAAIVGLSVKFVGPELGALRRHTFLKRQIARLLAAAGRLTLRLLSYCFFRTNVVMTPNVVVLLRTQEGKPIRSEPQVRSL